MASAAGNVRIGISGWRYEPWRGLFYPAGLAQRRELSYASRMLPTIEINGSFYSLQRPASWQQWHDDTPDDFVFAVKGPRYITHMLRLKEVQAPLSNFLASGVLALGAKLGPVLWQFPPQMPFDAERFDTFLSLLPRDTAAALPMAQQHDARMKGRSHLAIDESRPLRHAVEIRHQSFACPEFIALLRRHGIAAVVADTAGRWPLVQDLTADFSYLRLHGDDELYASGYGSEALDHWAARIRAWRSGQQPADAQLIAPHKGPHSSAHDVYCYLDNDVKVHAPYDAAHLAARLGIETGLGAGDQFVPPPGLLPPRRRAPGFKTAARG